MSSNDLSQGLSNLSIDDPNVSLGIRNLPRVSSERDTLTDSHHKLLDATILTTFSANRQIKQEPDLSSLLSNITHYDKRLKALSSDEAEDLLKDDKLIQVALIQAWRKGQFKEVRQLGTLYEHLRHSKYLIRQVQQSFGLSHLILSLPVCDIFIIVGVQRE